VGFGVGVGVGAGFVKYQTPTAAMIITTMMAIAWAEVIALLFLKRASFFNSFTNFLIHHLYIKGFIKKMAKSRNKN
jgi:hypothetical protein